MTRRTDAFVEMEYKEAVNAYFKGVETGKEWVRGLLSLQSLLFTAFGVLSSWDDGKYQYSTAVFVICLLGVSISLIYIPLLTHYGKLLDACSSRCVQIEGEFEGSLFGNIVAVRPASGFISALSGLKFISATIGVAWFGIAGFQLQQSGIL